MMKQSLLSGIVSGQFSPEVEKMIHHLSETTQDLEG